MSIGSILKAGAQQVGRTITKPIKALAPKKLQLIKAPERDQFESILHRHPRGLNAAETKSRATYLSELQKTDLRTYQDYLEHKALQFLNAAGVRPGPLQEELREELLYADHIRNNYSHFQQQHQQWNNLTTTPLAKPATAQAHQAAEARAFWAVERTLIASPKVSALKPVATLARPSLTKLSPGTATESPRLSATKSVALQRPPLNSAIPAQPRVAHNSIVPQTPLNLIQLFGADLKAAQFTQRSGNTCYMLALMDNILHHPLGRQLLESIQVHRTPRGYQVKFPAQAHAIEVLNEELTKGSTVRPHNPAHIGIPLMEQAFLKLPKVNSNDIGESLNALGHLFPENLLPNARPFNWNLSNPAAGLQALSPAQYKAQLQQLIQAVNANTEALPLMTALQNAHISSVRLTESSASEIKLLDPISGPKTLPIDDFIQQYQLIGLGKASTPATEGLRAALESNLTETLASTGRQAELNPEDLRTLKTLLLNDVNLMNRCYQAAPTLVNNALDLS